LEEEWANAGYGVSDGDDNLWLGVDDEEDITLDKDLDEEDN